MLSSSLKYGAIRAKVMALYGRMLGKEELLQLCDCSNIREFIERLRSFPQYEKLLDNLPAEPEPGQLDDAVRSEITREYEKIYLFSRMEDRRFLLLYVRRREYELILAALRRLESGIPWNREPVQSFLREHSSIDVAKLEECDSYQRLMDSISGSVYEKPLSTLPVKGESGLPEYRDAAILLENTYYRTAFSYLSKKYSGMDKVKLKAFLGMEADILNAVGILRLQRYFPGSMSKLDELLIPVSGRQGKQLVRELAAAHDYGEALAIFKKSPLGEGVGELEEDRLERLYDKVLAAFCKKLIHAPEPGMCTAQAYLTLNELQGKSLLRMSEAIRCGENPKKELIVSG